MSNPQVSTRDISNIVDGKIEQVVATNPDTGKSGYASGRPSEHAQTVERAIDRSGSSKGGK